MACHPAFERARSTFDPGGSLPEDCEAWSGDHLAAIDEAEFAYNALARKVPVTDGRPDVMHRRTSKETSRVLKASERIGANSMTLVCAEAELSIVGRGPDVYLHVTVSKQAPIQYNVAHFTGREQLRIFARALLRELGDH